MVTGDRSNLEEGGKKDVEMDGTLVDPSCSGLGARSPAGASRPTLTGGDLLGGAGVKLLRAAMNGVRRAPGEGIRCRYGAHR
jgi:16S rRNA C967 or C1407 C5-methylase (RsmB/RsmF family)